MIINLRKKKININITKLFIINQRKKKININIIKMSIIRMMRKKTMSCLSIILIEILYNKNIFVKLFNLIFSLKLNNIILKITFYL